MADTVEDAICDAWQASWRNLYLQTSDKVFIGTPPLLNEGQTATIEAPFFAVTFQAVSSVERNNEQVTLVTRTVKIETQHPLHAEAAKTAAAIMDHFNRFDEVYSRGRILDMRPGAYAEREDKDDGMWFASWTFAVLYSINPPVVA